MKKWTDTEARAEFEKIEKMQEASMRFLDSKIQALQKEKMELAKQHRDYLMEIIASAI